MKMLRDEAARLLTPSKYPVSWSSIPSLLPHRIRRRFRSTRSKLRSRITPSSSITSLQTSFDPSHTLHSLRTHQWSFYDGQYLFLAIVGIFSLCVTQSPGPLTKTFIATLLMTSLILPITRQFFLPFLPIIAWLVFYFSCQFIGAEYRPPIWVRVLPTLESVFYGANISNILSAPASSHYTILDILGWLPYGITHFGAPFVVSGLMFLLGPPGTLPIFARTFGYMNLAGVFIQMSFPCSPPWYENLYGLAPANYSIKGSPAGLAAIDKLFSIDLYTSTFTASPLVFGAFPSLHAGCATTEALFMSHLFPRLKPLFVAYVMWLWWATMYLRHHYAVDLVGGSLLAGVAFFIARAKFVPRVQSGKTWRWDYDYVERGEVREGYEYGITGFADSFDDFAALPGGDGARHGVAGSESDMWSLGSSSSYSPGDRSPSVGLRSPVDGHEEGAMEDSGSGKDGSGWDGETLASDSERR